MLILPVLDLLDGVVVRGVAGRRDEYHPIASRIAEKPDPLSVARAFRDRLGLTRLYIADLDAILHERPNGNVYRELSHAGFKLLIDAGLRNAESADAILAAGATQVVAGLETWPCALELRSLCERVGSERVVFSLDLRQGLPMGDLAQWKTTDPLDIAVSAVDAGAREMIVLDIAQVGVGGGVTTIDLCRRLREKFPKLRLITGGGVGSAADLRRLAELQLDGALVASALHDG